MDQPDVVRQRLALYEAASVRSARDPAFRARLIAEPVAVLDALAGELGLTARVPGGIRIAVHDWSADVLHLVLPPPIDPPLSEAQLDRVVGGFGLMASAKVDADAHGCPLCPHPATFAGSMPRMG